MKLGPPSPGDVTITVDPRRTGSAFSMGIETLLPGAEIPLHKHLAQDEVLFVHKGQGRAVLEGRAMTMVPGMMVYVPRQAWHSLRNTGTGLLQIAWTSVPPGIEEFFRELSHLGGSASPAAILEIAKRHGIEFPQDGQAPVAGAPAKGSRRRRHRHRGGRGGGRGGQPSQRRPPQETPSPRPSTAAAQGRGGSGGSAGPRAGPRPSAPLPPAPPPAQAPPPQAARSARNRPGTRRPPHSRRHVKEVYMGGRWVQVVGEGPVIAPGHGRSESQGQTRKDKRESSPGT